MKIILILIVVTCLLTLAGCWARRASQAAGPARHFFLSEDAPGLVRFLSGLIELADGERARWVTVTRQGKFTDPRYGEFEITRPMLEQMVANFDKRVLGQDVFLDVAHKPSDGAAAKVLRLAIEGTRLRALVEFTDFGVDAVRKRGFVYLSAEFHENWRDNEKGEAHGCVLLGAGLTIRPVIKNLDPVQLSQLDPDDEAKLAITPQFLKTLESDTMNKHLKNLRERLLKLGLTEDQIRPILDAALKQLEAQADDEAKCLATVETFAVAGETLNTQLKALAASGQQPGQIVLQVGAPAAGVDAASVKDLVKKALSDQAAAAAADQATLEGKVKLLSDTVMGDKALSEDVKKELVDGAAPLITKELSDDQVKGLATMLLSQASKSSAAAMLATIGYRPASGSVHIAVGEPAEIKKLQAEIDKRLGFDGMPDDQRYENTGGRLLDANKRLAEQALAEFDAANGHRLLAEHKLLAGGVGQIADISVPVSVERTVLRESLYQLAGLALCNVGTHPFAPVVQIPYSYRDTTAAGVSTSRVYELQPVQRAGIIQTMDEIRPIPQKLAYQISNEMRYLLGAAPFDFEPLAENVRNIIRIFGEDTDRLIHNELINAADEAVTQAFNETLTAQVNGTNKIFVTAAFPIVRPRRAYNLKGELVGNVQNPVTVTLNGVARSEYIPGATLSAGLYWICDYNQGEWRFVNELGVLQTPTSGWVLNIQGTQSLNVAKQDLYPGATPTRADRAAVYDDLLQLIGGRKVVVENDRYYTANLLLMSGAVDNALGVAPTFSANASRAGTGLNPDGSVGRVKGIPAFNTKAPGLLMGDSRILVGERGNTRFRMVKPFAVKDGMQQARDANGRFIGAEENWGDQYIAVGTPAPLKNSATSIVLYNSAARVARAA